MSVAPLPGDVVPVARRADQQSITSASALQNQVQYGNQHVAIRSSFTIGVGTISSTKYRNIIYHDKACTTIVSASVADNN